MLERITRIMNMTGEEIKNHPHLLVNVLDQEYRVLFWNRQCERYFGITEAEALDNKIEDLLPGIMQNEKIDFVKRAFAGAPLYLVNLNYERKVGSYDWVVLPLKKEDGSVFAVLNIIIDLLQDRKKSQKIFTLPDSLRNYDVEK
jgi:PAS domain S-box-containing protein